MFALSCHIAVRKISTTTAIIIGIRLEDFEASILNWLNSGSNMEPEGEKTNNKERKNCFKTYNSMERYQFRIGKTAKGSLKGMYCREGGLMSQSRQNPLSLAP